MPKIKREKKSFFKSKAAKKEAGGSLKETESFQTESVSEEKTNE